MCVVVVVVVVVAVVVFARIYWARTDASKRRDHSPVAVVWCREETRWVRCTARRTQASEPTPTAFLWSLAAERRAERRLGISYFTM